MRVTTANLDFVRGGDRRYLAHLCETADVVCVQEAKDVDLAAIVPAGWAALQDFEGGPDRAGSGICYRTATVDIDIDDFTLVLGARPQSGVKMLTRWIAQADATEKATGRKARVFAAHAPKRDTGLQPLYYRRLKAAVATSPLPVVVGGDFNRPHDAVATLLGLHGVGEGIIGVLADKRCRFGTVRVDDTGMDNGWTDHPSVAVPLGLPKEIPAVTKVEIYPRANHTVQWYADNFPGVRFDANCGVLHTTEGTDWPGYEGGATAPNLTAKPDIAGKRLMWRQHFPIDMSSRALRNEAGGVETNTLNTAQVELVGTCDPKHRVSWNGQGELLAGKHYIYWPDAPDWALAGLAEFLRWCNTEHGIPLTGAKTWLPYPKSFGSTAGNRFTFAQWRAFTGWCGHQHVPENSHGDPGDLDFARLLELADPDAVTPPPEPHPSPRWDLVWETADDLAGDYASGTARGDAARKIRNLAAQFSTKH